MRVLGIVLSFAMVVGATPAYALFDDESVNADAKSKAQAAALAGAAAGAGAVAGGGDSYSSTSSEYREYRNAARGSTTQYVPVGNEGQSLLTPWGGGTAQKQGEITKLSMVYDMCGADVDCQADVLSQAIEAAKPCSFLGAWPKRVGGPLCWAPIRIKIKK